MGGNSYEDDESIFTFHDRESLQYSITSTDDTCSKETKGKIFFSILYYRSVKPKHCRVRHEFIIFFLTKGIKENLKQLNEINEISGSLLPIQIHQTESVGLASGAVPKRSSNKLTNHSKVNWNIIVK